MNRKMLEKNYKTNVIQSPSTFGELEYNELKLTSLISEIEKDIMILRLQKAGHAIRREEEEMERRSISSEKVAPGGSVKWFDRIKNYFSLGSPKK
mgnify:CR=1 FL=1